MAQGKVKAMKKADVQKKVKRKVAQQKLSRPQWRRTDQAEDGKHERAQETDVQGEQANQRQGDQETGESYPPEHANW